MTLAFWQSGKITWADALWYVLAQAAGGIGAMLLLAHWLAPYYAYPRIHYITTKPGPGGMWVAFAAEFGMSAGLMALLLLALHSARLHKATGWLLGALLAAYIICESPLSGMSVNPSRSLAAAVAANDFTNLWGYLLAPPAAAWLVACGLQWQRAHAAAGFASSAPPTEPPCYPTA